MDENGIIYLDNAATTRTAPEVVEEMLPWFSTHYGNASSKYYQMGRKALAAVETAREQIASLIGAASPEEIYFTSCGTESDNWALKACACCRKNSKNIVTSTIEHHAILHTTEFLEKTMGLEVKLLGVDSMGIVNTGQLSELVDDNTGIVSIMHANNEVGTMQPIKELAEIAHAKGALFHTDAVQTVGKVPVNVEELGVDLLSISGHKLHAPKGVGVLYVRKGTRIGSYVHGGGQERGKRAGTTNVPGIVGLGKAAELAAARMNTETDREFKLVETLWEGLNGAITKIHRNGHPSQRLPGILNIRVEGAEGEAILGYLDMFGIEISSGSACATGSLDPSHVLLAMGIKQEDAHGSLRFSLSHETTAEDIAKVIEVVPQQIHKIREMSVTWKG